MHITESLVRKFFDGRCTPEEAAAVSRYLQHHPEVWQRLMAESWDSSGQGVEGAGSYGDDAGELPAGTREEMLEQIRKRVFARPAVLGRRIPVRVLVRATAVAASVLLVVAGVWFLVKTTGSQERSSMPVAAAAKPAVHGGGMEDWQLSANRTDQRLKLRLGDGSFVTLLPHSSIRYARHFSDGSSLQRDIYLQGQAYFEAARDRKRPLTVYAGKVATTVLGTHFSVHESETGVIVKLYSGKVRVHSAEDGLARWKKDVYLSPGQELKYDAKTALAKVDPFREEGPAARKRINGLPAGSEEELSFDNTALPEVMQKLITHYRTPIAYNPAELGNMYFSGSVLPADSLSVILRVIGNMNDLKIEQTKTGFMVHPSKQ